MKPCNKVSEDARLECKEALTNFKDQKMKRNELLQEIGMGPSLMHESALSKTIETLGSESGSISGSGEPIPRGPMDKFTTSQSRQTTLNSKWKQEERKEVCRKIARFKPPSMHELRTWILKEEVNDLSIIMEDHKKAWKQYGCSIMSDGWTDGKSRYLDEVVEEIGEENVVQVITDNASNYVNVGMRLMEKMRKLWWTPCATHCIDLILEDIGKLNVHATTLSRARQVVKFIYGHTWVLSLMRTSTKNHELLRPTITRFVTAFLTLQSLYKQKQALIECSPQKNGVQAHGLKSALRKVDSEERPAMGYIYELMDSTKEKIAFNCRVWRENMAQFGEKLMQDGLRNFIDLYMQRVIILILNCGTSGGKGKEKELNLTPIDEDEDLHEMGIHDSGHFPTVDTLDEDDDDLGDEDLS
ncbi:hypothetical protein CK203_016188 [Vitis vinifera]|uniref:DUF659 domain-containing protein n=1 Tax=Vitis vinifera TaxID=29760 RepID=A0A438JMR3_VITVI|nr:hypothetical protein CK203_016188 [Vitis vinifera]